MPGPSYVPDDAEDVTNHGGTMGTDVSLSVAESNANAIEGASVASSGNNVYIPSGTLEFANSTQAGAIRFGASNDGAEGASVYGAGPSKTFLKTNINQPTDAIPEIWYTDSSSDHGDITWQGLTYDGNDNLTGFYTDGGRQRGFTLHNGGTANSVTMQNFRMRHINRNGFAITSDFPGVSGTVDRCTFYDISIESMKEADADGNVLATHSFSGSGFITSGNPWTFTNSLWQLVAGNIIDTNSAGDKATFENCYAEGIGDAWIKAGSELDRVELINCHLVSQTQELLDANSGISGVEFRGRHLAQRQKSGSGAQEIRVDNVKVDNASSTAVFAGAGSWDIGTLSGGGPLAFVNHLTDPNSENEFNAGFRGRNGDDYTFNLDELSIHGATDITIFDFSSGSGSITDLHRETGTSLGDQKNVSIGTDNEGGSPFEPDVPAPSEVGINSSGTASGEIFTEDWITYVDGQTPNGWTAEFGATASNYTVQNPGVPEAPVLEFESSNEGIRAFSWDDVGEATDFDVVGLVSFEDTDNYHDWVRLYIRGSGDSSTYTGYFTTYMYDSQQGEYILALRRYDNGSLSTLGSVGVGQISGDTRWIRLRSDGTRLMVRDWDYGVPEPSTWDIDTNDSVIGSGWFGVGSYTSDLQRWHYLGVGTEGETVSPLPLDVDVTTLDAANVLSEQADIKGRLDVYDSINQDAAELFLQYRQDGDQSWTDVGGDVYTTTPQEITETVSNLSKDTVYEYRAAADHHLLEVETKNLASKDSTEATLEGNLTTLNGPSDVDVFFKWRDLNDSTFNDTSRQTVSSTGTFTHQITGLTEGNDYEFVAAVDSTTDPTQWTKKGSGVTFTAKKPETLMTTFQDLNDWGGSTGAASVDTSQSVDDGQSCYMGGFNNQIYSHPNDHSLPVYPSRGDTFRGWIRADSGDPGSDIGYGFLTNASTLDQGGDGYLAEIDASSNEMRINRFDGGTGTNLTSKSVTLNTGTWYEIVVELGSTDSITFKLLDSNGNQVDSLSTTDSNYSDSGVVCSEFDPVYFDYLRVAEGVN